MRAPRTECCKGALLAVKDPRHHPQRACSDETPSLQASLLPNQLQHPMALRNPDWVMCAQHAAWGSGTLPGFLNDESESRSPRALHCTPRHNRGNPTTFLQHSTLREAANAHANPPHTPRYNRGNTTTFLQHSTLRDPGWVTSAFGAQGFSPCQGSCGATEGPWMWAHTGHGTRQARQNNTHPLQKAARFDHRSAPNPNLGSPLSPKPARLTIVLKIMTHCSTNQKVVRACCIVDDRPRKPSRGNPVQKRAA